MQDPKFIGGLVGVPTEDRDRANRLALEREIAAAREALPLAEARLAQARKKMIVVQTSPQAAILPVVGPREAAAVKELMQAQVEVAAARKRFFGAKNLKDQLENVTKDPVNSLKRPDVFLLDFNAAFAGGDGRAVVAFGDPSKAKNVGVVVPGIMNSLKNVQSPLQNAADLRTAVRRTSGEAVAAESATIMWLGYDTPNGVVKAPTKGMAKVGASGSSLTQR